MASGLRARAGYIRTALSRPIFPQPRLICAIVGCVALGATGRAQAAKGYIVTPDADSLASSPAYRYANLSNEEAFAELDRRGVPYWKEAPVAGVRAPIRLSGPLHGVQIHSSLPAEQWATTPFEILDARLGLSLDDFAALLSRHEIVELVHYTMYRPNGPKDDPGAKGELREPPGPSGKDRGGKRGAHGTGRGKGARPVKGAKGEPEPALGPSVAGKKLWAPPGTRHPAGLAIDVGSLRKRDGRWLNISSQFEGHIGATTCGPQVRWPESANARELWSIVCESSDLRLFTYVLTPNFDAPHADHWHMEISGLVPWFSVH